MQYCLGPVVHGVAPPIPDVHDGLTLMAGARARFLHQNPKPSALQGAAKFIDKWLKRYLTPLKRCDLMTKKEYIEGTNHPLWRKMELTLAAESLEESPLCREDMKVKMFGKMETHMQYKHARCINSRVDRFKVYSGLFFHAIEKQLYDLPEFIKHVPVKDRPRFVVDRLGNHPGPYYETDYSHFESHFTPAILRIFEMRLYKYMLAEFPAELRNITAALTGKNRCSNVFFTVVVPGTRMSGEMCTSLGNGFTNLMLAKYAAYRKGGHIDGFVEGDDGLFVCSKPLTKEDFAALGFDIKILSYSDLLLTSFCGLSFTRSMASITDPIEVLLNFPWTHSPQANGVFRVRMGLLRAKALSLLYEHPRCPILSVMAKRYIDLTVGVTPRFTGGWYERKIESETILYFSEALEAYSKGIDDVTRADFDRVYNISAALQVRIEDEIKAGDLNSLGGPCLRSLLLDRVHEDCIRYYRDFVCQVGVHCGRIVMAPAQNA